MAKNKDEERKFYIKLNHLEDSFIDAKTLYQHRNVIPQRKFLGKTRNGKYQIFFEETSGSLVKRNYGKSEKVTSWNLLFSDGKKSEKITEDFINNNELVLFNFTVDELKNFLKNNSKRSNYLDNKNNKKDRKIHSIWANDEEFEIIQEFIKKLRARENG